MFELFNHVNIPKHRILFLHVKLRELRALTDHSYHQLTHNLLHTIQQLYQPVAILVPTYTIYTFMFGRVFHLLFSQSEVGRFSEEVRRHFTQFRTPDPMFSVADVMGYLPHNVPETVYRKMFGRDGLLYYLMEQDYVIVNIGLEVLYATQVHLVENLVGVDYRFEKEFAGVMYYDEQHWEKVVYPAYVRSINVQKIAYPSYDQAKRERYLLERGELQTVTNQNIKIAWISSQLFSQSIQSALLQDRHFLIKTT